MRAGAPASYGVWAHLGAIATQRPAQLIIACGRRALFSNSPPRPPPFIGRRPTRTLELLTMIVVLALASPGRGHSIRRAINWA